jgi:phenylacetate-coenzyme A ligase PaaK-like adenylate-forming protein
LHDKIDRTAAFFPWYGQLLKESGIDRSAIRSIEQLPLVTSELLERFYYGRDRPYAEPSGELENTAGRVSCYRTSGTSSNRRKTIYYSPEDERNYIRIKADLFRRLLADSNIRTALSDMGTGHAASTAMEIFSRLGVKADSIPFELPIARHLERLTTLRPQALYTMPSILDRLLASPDEDASSCGIRRVILVGEIAAPSWQRSVAERLGLTDRDIVDTYGSIEIGTIAYYSHEHGRYLFVEGIKPEGIPAHALGGDPEPLPDGEAVLVLTSYTRELFPALRYVTYDIVRDLRPIRVEGVWRQSFQAIVRRIGPELKHGEKISVYDIEDVIYRHLPEAHASIRVRGRKLTVLVDGGQGNSELFARIENELMDRIPEIGTMIRGGLLDAIQVLPADIPLEDKSMKQKKVFYD